MAWLLVLAGPLGWIGLFIMIFYASLYREQYKPLQWSKISRTRAFSASDVA